MRENRKLVKQLSGTKTNETRSAAPAGAARGIFF